MQDLILRYGDLLLALLIVSVLIVSALYIKLRILTPKKPKKTYRGIDINAIYQGLKKEFDKHTNSQSSKCLVNKNGQVFLKVSKPIMINDKQLVVSVFRKKYNHLFLYQIKIGGYIFVIDETEIVQVLLEDYNGARLIEGQQLKRHLEKTDSFMNIRKDATFHAVVDFLQLAESS